MSRDPGKITLIRTTTGWSARFTGDVAEVVRSAFGTDTIPTAYTAQATAKEVAEGIRFMWPKCYVTVEEGQ